MNKKCNCFKIKVLITFTSYTHKNKSDHYLEYQTKSSNMYITSKEIKRKMCEFAAYINVQVNICSMHHSGVSHHVKQVTDFPD